MTKYRIKQHGDGFFYPQHKPWWSPWWFRYSDGEFIVGFSTRREANAMLREQIAYKTGDIREWRRLAMARTSEARARAEARGESAGDYIKRNGAIVIDQHPKYGTLYKAEVDGGESMVAVHVVNATPNEDGTREEFWLRVPPTMRTAREAVAWTFGLERDDYSPQAEA